MAWRPVLDPTKSLHQHHSGDTELVFRLTRASKHEREKLLTAAREAPLSSPPLLTLADGPLGTPPRGFVHDLSRSHIGRGQHAFAAAREAFQRWEEFDLGWVRIANPIPQVLPGELVGVEVCTARLWSINVSRIVEIVDSPTHFGFMYTTTTLHVEEGQERFVVEFDPGSESVLYLTEAISRPRHILARVAYPFSRAMQHRFARDSHARMKRCVLESLIRGAEAPPD
jgi:uncharacterized protein (UPF0548 family)